MGELKGKYVGVQKCTTCKKVLDFDDQVGNNGACPKCGAMSKYGYSFPDTFKETIFVPEEPSLMEKISSKVLKWLE